MPVMPSESYRWSAKPAIVKMYSNRRAVKFCPCEECRNSCLCKYITAAARSNVVGG